MRVYPTAARLSFRRYLSYRGSLAAGAFTNTVFGFIRAYLLLAVWVQKPQLAGYTATDAVTYVFLSQALIGPLSMFVANTELGARIRSGDVAADLYRPGDLQLWFLSLDGGRAGAALVLRTAPPVIIGALAFGTALRPDPLPWLEFGCCLLLALVISFAIRYLVSLSAFWTLDERGAAALVVVVAMFTSGMIVPVGLMPGWLAGICYALPWAATLQIPINTLLGAQPGGFAAALAGQAAWAAGLLLLGRLVTAAARRRAVVQGG